MQATDSAPNQATESAAEVRRNGFPDRLRAVLRIASEGRIFPLILGTLAIVMSATTYIAMTDETFRLGTDAVLALLVSNLVLLLLLGALVARRIVALWSQRRSGTAGSRLHVRLVTLFSIIAIVPTISVMLFTALFFYFGLQNWFSERVQQTIQNSVSIAGAYTKEHRKAIQADIALMASDLSRQATLFEINSALFEQAVFDQAILRGLDEAVVLSGRGDVIARANLRVGLLSLGALPRTAIEQAEQGDIVTLAGENDDRVRALVKLDRFVDRYLYVSRLVDPQVLALAENTRSAARDYFALEEDRSDLQLNFNLIFLAVALLVLLAAIWVGLGLANNLVAPIGQLVRAAEKVRGGDLSARVGEADTEDEVNTLSRAFNRMTSQLESQQNDLLSANLQLDQRRRFTEAVLAGVTAGVLGLDDRGRLDLPNRSALALLNTTLEDIHGRHITKVVPELTAIFRQAQDVPGQIAEGQINILRAGQNLTLNVRISTELADGRIVGFVVTLDDITKLVQAQRTAAWADVARRIAHEIRNPLTPIQLSAERLSRKYREEIATDPDVFQQCTQTIVRQVGDIRRMVDEFSGFARMPAPVFAEVDVNDLIRQSVFLVEMSARQVRFSHILPETPIRLSCDEGLISQALTNVLKNAAESIQGRMEAEENPSFAGTIDIRLVETEDDAVIEVADNGLGLPEEMKSRLTEPYVTTRSKGTGLGLAIVEKIMTEHEGRLELVSQENGALVRLILPKRRGEAPALETENPPLDTDMKQANAR